MHIYSFEKLEVWTPVRDLCADIYKVTNAFSTEEKFGLVSQKRRASVSIASCIAEERSRIDKKDQSHIHTVSFSAAPELLNQLILSYPLIFITKNQLHEAGVKIEPITKGLSNLKRSTLKSQTSE